MYFRAFVRAHKNSLDAMKNVHVGGGKEKRGWQSVWVQYLLLKDMYKINLIIVGYNVKVQDKIIVFISVVINFESIGRVLYRLLRLDNR